MADKKITLKLDADTKDFDAKTKASINRLQREIRQANNQAIGRNKPQLPPGFDKERLAEYRRISDQLRKIETANAIETARQVTATKKSELKQFENLEKSKQRIVEISAKGQLQAQNHAFRSIENAQKRQYQDFVRMEREKTRLAQAEARKRASSGFGNRLDSAGERLQAVGGGLTATLTAPLITLATLGTRAAISLDAVRQKFVGIEGSVEKANKRIKELQDFAFGTKGVTTEQAFETYTQLKPLKVGDDVIKKQTAALGNLGQGADFSRNLLQIFQQGFERGDIKEAIGRMPLFETILTEVAAKFNAKDTAGLKQLKESGKLTLDQFLSGFADAVNNNPNFANAGEAVGVKLQKTMERLNAALVPLGEVILATLIPIIQQVSPYIEQLASYFSSLSPQIQTAIVVIGAFAAALGPVLIALGALALGVKTAIAVIGSIAGAVASVSFIPIIAGLAAVGVAVYAAYQAWEKNIGGIQQTATEVFNNLRTIIEPAVAEVSAFIQQSFGEVVAWVESNLPTLVEAVQNVVKYISKIWAENGEQIKSIVSSAWQILKTVITTIGTQIGNAVLLIANLINGNWKGAWNNFVAIIGSAIKASGTIFGSLLNIVWEVLKAILTRVVSMGGEFYNASLSIGTNISQGIIDGIKSKATVASVTAQTFIGSVLNVFRTVPIIRSPSKVTTEIGEFIGEGLAIGIENKIERAKSAAKKISNEVLKELQNALKEFDKLAGASPQTIANIQATDRIQDATGGQQEIIKLRDQLKVNLGKPLPSDVMGTEIELADLKRLEEGAKAYGERWNQINEDLAKGAEETRQQRRDDAKALDDRIKQIQESGATELLNLQREIDLMGETDPLEKLRIENYYEILELRQQMMADGFAEHSINEAVRIKQVEQGRLQELQEIKIQREQYLEQIEKQKEAEKKAVEEIKRAYEDLKNTIVDVLDIITDPRGGSLKDRLGDVFEYASERLRESFIDRVGGSLATSIFGFDPTKSNNPVVNEIAESNKYLKTIASVMTGQPTIGGAFPNAIASTGKVGGILGSILGGGGNLGNRGGIGSPMIMNAGSSGGWNQMDIITALGGGTNVSPIGGSGGSIFSNLKGIFSSKPGSGGIFADRNNILTGKTSNLAGWMGGAGDIAAIIGGFLPGKLGSSVSLAGTGMSIGSSFGPWGALAGGLIGGIAGLFGDSSQKKQENQSFTEAAQATLAELDKIIAALDTRPNPQIEPLQARAAADSILNQYRASASSLKTGVRNTALNMLKPTEAIGFRSRMVDDAVARTLIYLKTEANRSATVQNFAGFFADGGAVSSFARMNLFNGRVPGSYDRRDDKYIAVSGDEVVLNPSQWRPISSYLSQINLPNFPKAYADGGTMFSTPRFSPSFAAPSVSIDITVNAPAGVDTAQVKEMVREGVTEAFNRPETKDFIFQTAKVKFNQKAT